MKAARIIHSALTLSSSMLPEVCLVWHRGRDLRLHDNALYSDLDSSNGKNSYENSEKNEPSSVASVYVLNEAEFMPRPSTCRPEKWDAVSMGPHAARVLLESLHDLRSSLRSIGGELLVVEKKNNAAVLQVLLDMIRDLGVTEMRWNEEPGVYERQQSDFVRKAIRREFPSVRIKTCMQYTLYHPDDLPYGPDEWNRLAHPNQQNKKRNKNKNKKKNHKNKNNNKQQNARTEAISSPTTVLEEQDVDIANISPERFYGMPRIMGEFRKAARNKMNGKLRPSYETPKQLRLPKDSLRKYFVVVGGGGGTDDITSTDTDTDNNNSNGNGKIPTLEKIMQPLLGKLQEQQQHEGHEGGCQSILGVNPKVLERIITNALAVDRIRQKPLPPSSSLEDHDNTDSYIIGGGETEALRHLEDFCKYHAGSAVRNLADVSNNQSSRFSHFLAFGCLSPRRIVEEASKNCNHNNDWIISHMTMRDFFLYTCLACHVDFYQLKGIPVGSSTKKKNNKIKANENEEEEKKGILWNSFNDDDYDDGTSTINMWKHWTEGSTGLPLIDATMGELIKTGYCSNRVRQNVASVLCKDLKVDWRAGAEYFQFCLIDHCVGANWGNWLYFSGVGPDPKQRHFRTISQALKYDPNGSYVQKWLSTSNSSSSLAHVVANSNNENDDNKPTKKMNSDDKNNNGNDAYLRPWDFDPTWKVIIDPNTQYTWQDKQRLDETGSLLPLSSQEGKE